MTNYIIITSVLQFDFLFRLYFLVYMFSLFMPIHSLGGEQHLQKVFNLLNKNLQAYDQITWLITAHCVLHILQGTTKK